MHAFGCPFSAVSACYHVRSAERLVARPPTHYCANGVKFPILHALRNFAAYDADQSKQSADHQHTVYIAPEASPAGLVRGEGSAVHPPLTELPLKADANPYLDRILYVTNCCTGCRAHLPLGYQRCAVRLHVIVALIVTI